MAIDLRRSLRLMGRALRLRCPNCGSGGLWDTYFRIRERCPGCGIRLERGESGYVVGAATFNIIVAELSFMAVFVGLLFATWPSPPWVLLQWGGLAMMVAIPIRCRNRIARPDPRLSVGAGPSRSPRFRGSRPVPAAR